MYIYITLHSRTPRYRTFCCCCCCCCCCPRSIRSSNNGLAASVHAAVVGSRLMGGIANGLQKLELDMNLPFRSPASFRCALPKPFFRMNRFVYTNARLYAGRSIGAAQPDSPSFGYAMQWSLSIRLEPVTAPLLDCISLCSSQL